MLRRDRVLWALASLLSFLLLIAPAIWNRFPLLQYDTGGYLARWYEGTLVISRAVVYGLILNAGAALDFWPVVALQAALTVWVFALVLRAHRLNRPLILLGIVAALSFVTTLPWLASILLTDIFCGVGVLAFYLVVVRGDALQRWERIALVILVAVSAATHSATLAVLLAMLAAGAFAFLLDRARVPLAGLGRGFVALSLGTVLVFAANYLIVRQLTWTPGGFALSFGRMLQDGIVKKYLDEHCPTPALQLCAYKNQLPLNADEWFWGSPLFDKLGRFRGLNDEMEEIALDSVADYPTIEAETALRAMLRQLLDVHTGEGVVNTIWHTYGIMKDYTPWVLPAVHAARQQKDGISFKAINYIDWPVGLLSMALLPVIVIVGWRRKGLTDIGDLALVIMGAIMANAIVCGAFANPHDRYGARVVWLSTFAVLVALAALRQPAESAARQLPRA
ncbi:MAG: hypothetical protein WBD48_00510 [Pseudolabrys sp.]